LHEVVPQRLLQSPPGVIVTFASSHAPTVELYPLKRDFSR
jgi:hypothetical protein